MAENKKSFLLYTDVHHTVKKLTDEQAGKLFKHILSYVNDENPEINDFIIEIAFEPIKQSLKRDLEKYKAIIERNKINGSKGGRPKSSKSKPKKPSRLINNPNNPAEPKKADSDSDSDSDIHNSWRDDFSVYLEECKKGYRKFMENNELLKTQQRLNPGINIKLSIEKGYVNFWSTEAGWKHKKKSKTTEIDWDATIVNSIGMNKVYYTKQEMEKQLS